jgi:hypothetical protein
VIPATETLSIVGADDACAEADAPHARQLIAANAAKPTVHLLTWHSYRYAPI